MKGVVLAGGTGSRLDPLTRATNKHLLPLGREPMVCRALRAFAQAGVDECIVVTGSGHMEAFGRQLAGCGDRVLVAGQARPGGIAEALGLAAEFAAGGPVAVLLADNVWERPLASFVEAFVAQRAGARCLLSRVADQDVLAQAGVPVMGKVDGRIQRVEEKPAAPASCYVVTGAYVFDAEVWRILPRLTPSARGELEITDVLNAYAARSALEHDIIGGYWADAGQSIDAYYAACDFVRGLETA